MTLKAKAIDAIRTDSNLRAKLMLVEGKSEYTIKRWIQEDDDDLTKPKYLAVIKDHTGLSEADILETVNA